MGNCHCPIVVAKGSCVKCDEGSSAGRDGEEPISVNPVLLDGCCAAAGGAHDGAAAAAAAAREEAEAAAEDLRAEEESDDNEAAQEPKPFRRPRGGAVSAEPFITGYYKEPYWNKHNAWEKRLFETLSKCSVFKKLKPAQRQVFVRAMEIHLRYKGECIAEEGEPGDALFIVLHGSVGCYRKGELWATRERGEVIDEHSVLWSSPRAFTMKAQNDCIVAKLCRTDYVNLSIRLAFYSRESQQQMLRCAKMLEMMDDESIARLADVLRVRTYKEGDEIITQGELGTEFFILTAGEAAVTVRTADDEQEHMRYKPGDLFGEVALLTDKPRAATVTAVNGPVEVLYLRRRQFERLFGEMAQLQAKQYLSDPRKLIADFYETSDSRGPRGSLRLQSLEPDPALPPTSWFAVYRPTSREAIAKMLSGTAVGKGLNVKGKSAKQGLLSGFVPFVQISDNKHKQMIEDSPPAARLKVYYRTAAARKEALRTLEIILQDAHGTLAITQRRIDHDERYEATGAFGLDLPEPLLREAYIMKQDLSPVLGWETGRRSEPAFMDANLHAIRDRSDPKVVLYQIDETDPMNPRGLLIAYAEKFVKPVVSDFDTFLIGSRGMSYEPLPPPQAQLVVWSLDQTAHILKTRDHSGWMSRWLAVLKSEGERGFHPEIPKFGFGDPTSYRLITDVVAETSPCGAIRHGAECSNFYFPQELDDEYLVVWHGYPDKPWSYTTEEDLRAFLLDRVREGFSFPLNPVWPVRDRGWYQVLAALRASEEAKACLSCWFPPEVGILERIDEVHRQYPEGFRPAKAAV